MFLTHRVSSRRVWQQQCSQLLLPACCQNGHQFFGDSNPISSNTSATRGWGREEGAYRPRTARPETCLEGQDVRPYGQRRAWIWCPCGGQRPADIILVARFPGSKNPTRRALGEYGALTLDQARGKARDWLELIRKGVDPRDEEERTRLAAQRQRETTFEAVVEEFIRLALIGPNPEKPLLRSAPRSRSIYAGSLSRDGAAGLLPRLLRTTSSRRSTTLWAGARRTWRATCLRPSGGSSIGQSRGTSTGSTARLAIA